MHPGVVPTTPVPTPSPTVFVAPPFPSDQTSFVVGAKNNAVITVQKGLIKVILLPKTYKPGTMDTNTINAVAKFEKQNPGLGVKGGVINQVVYDVLKSKL